MNNVVGSVIDSGSDSQDEDLSKAASFQCSVCRGSFSNETARGNHERDLHGMKYKLRHCTKQFLFVAGLVDHYSADHKGLKHYCCQMQDCGKWLEKEKTLLSHRRQKHWQTATECRYCRDLLPKKDIEKHLREFHKRFPSNKSINDGERSTHDEMFQCRHCDRVFEFVQDLETHSKVHNQYSYRCHIPKCGKSYCLRRSLYQHWATNHMGTATQCRVCGDLFANEDIERHLENCSKKQLM